MRKKRLGAILQIIRENEVENQETLLDELKKLGFEVTQATVSRDIKYLELEKSPSENGIVCYARKSAVKPSSGGIFSQGIIKADYALNTVVLKCRPGWAGAACDAFDRMNFHHTVGTIAGDDTVFILTRTEKDAKDLYEKILGLL